VVGDGDAGVTDAPVLPAGVPAPAGAGEVEGCVAPVDPPSVDAGPVAFGPEPHAVTMTSIAAMAAKRGLERRLCIVVFRIEDAPLDRPGQAV
jgi:hypothetical protein